MAIMKLTGVIHTAILVSLTGHSSVADCVQYIFAGGTFQSVQGFVRFCETGAASWHRLISRRVVAKSHDPAEKLPENGEVSDFLIR